MKAFIDCLLFAGVMKPQHETCEQLWSADVEHALTFESMHELELFFNVMKFLLFDNKHDHADRRESDKLAAFRDVREKFLQDVAPAVYHLQGAL